MRRRLDSAGRGERAEPGAGEPAPAERRVKRREDGPPVAALERDALRIRGHVDPAEAGAEADERRCEPGEVARERDEDERRAGGEQGPDRDRAAAYPSAQPAGEGHGDERAERGAEQRQPETCVREARGLLHGRDARGPRAEQQAVGEEDGGESDPRAPHQARTTSMPSAR